jgi:hypothetical protein
MSEQKVEPTKDFILRAKPAHPNRRYYIQKHVIEEAFGRFKLTDKEQKELAAPGAAEWVEIGDEDQLKADQKLRKQIKKPDPKDKNKIK